MKQKTSFFEWFVLFIIILLELVILYFRAITPATELNQLTTVLVSTFEILFSLYIGYFLQKLDSLRQSKESLKDMGLLAYRRVLDIKKSIRRSFSEIERINKHASGESAGEINVLRSILEGTYDTVESSVLDWVDFIGDDLSKKEKVEQLQEELKFSKFITPETETEKEKIKQLQREIDKLKSELPDVLKIENNEQKRFVKYMNHIFSLQRDDGKYVLSAKLQSVRPFSTEEENSIVNGSPYLLRISYQWGNLYLDVYNKEKKKIGRVIPSIEYDRFITDSPYAASSEYEYGDAKTFFLAFDNIFGMDGIEERDDGYYAPPICEFGGYVGEKYFNVVFSSPAFRGG